MLVDELCFKLFLWPLFTHLASLKGYCKSFTAQTIFPLITLSTSTISTSTITVNISTISTISPTTIPTFQPTLPTNTTSSITTTSTTTTSTPVNCPPVPFLCLPGGISPNPPCPCIDPRTQRLPAEICLTSSKSQGQCRLVENCPNLIEEYFFKLQTTPITFDAFLKTITCDNTDVTKICCPVRITPRLSATLQILGQPPTQQIEKQVSLNKPGVSIFSFSALNYNTVSDVYDDSMIVPLSIIGNGPAMASSSTGKPTLPPVTNNNNKLQPGAIPKSSLGQCGMNVLPQTRIVGGSEAKRGAYPWIAALAYILNKNEPAEFLCGGSLITTRHVLTAAHCINNDLTFVRLGAYNLSAKEVNAVDIKVLKKMQHEQYNINTNANDIALLRLEKDTENADHIVPVCLPYNITKDLVGMNPFIAGWGAQKFKGTTSNVLREAQVQVVGLPECKKNYATKFVSISIDDKFICAGGGQIDTCQGDSGGPLMLPQLDTIKTAYYFYLIGVVSFGFECGVPGYPGVYTRVNSYLTWIENKVKL